MVQVIKVLLVALICTQKDPGKRLTMIDVVEFFETPTDPGIFVQHDRASFHLGFYSDAAGASNIFQEEVKIPANRGSFSVLHNVMEAAANPNNLNIIHRGIRGVVSKVQLHSSLVCAKKKVTFAENKRNILSIAGEVEILGKIRHRNLVRMIACSLKKDYGLIWYEYLPNGNLLDVLHEKNPPPSLKWNVRYTIATGIAHGLAYLHYDCDPAIVHCAIKPKSILLDCDMEPQIADFSIAKLLDQCSSVTPSLSILGTLGNITPENTYTTAISRESDVYSYGIVLLQLVTRKKAVDPSFLGGFEIGVWVRTLWSATGDISKIVDSILGEEVTENSNVLDQVTKVLSVGLRCTEMDPRIRPTMRDVIKLLEDANPRSGPEKEKEEDANPRSGPKTEKEDTNPWSGLEKEKDVIHGLTKKKKKKMLMQG